MGAGAGYTIDVNNGELVWLDQSLIVPVRLDGFILEVKCDGTVVGNIEAASYYYGTGSISDVRMQLSKVQMYIPIGEGINASVLTPEAVAKYTSRFGVINIEDLYQELSGVLEVEDIDSGFISDAIRDARYSGTSEVLSAGWSHSTFDGDFKLKIDDSDEYNYIESAYLTIAKDYVTEFIDQAVTGDNVQYVAFEDMDVIDAFATQEEAIDFLKSHIREMLKNYEDISDFNFSDYTVEEEFYYMTDGDGNIGDSEYGEVVWEADESDFV